MFVVDVTNPITLLLLLAGTLLLIFLGKEIKRPGVAALPLILFLVLVIMHSAQLAMIPEVDYDLYRSVILGCITVDLVMIFITFFGYLWIDDIACRFYKKKSIDNSLDWFWKEV